MVGGERAREQSDPRARSLAGRHRPPVSRADISRSRQGSRQDRRLRRTAAARSHRSHADAPRSGSARRGERRRALPRPRGHRRRSGRSDRVRECLGRPARRRLACRASLELARLTRRPFAAARARRSAAGLAGPIGRSSALGHRFICATLAPRGSVLSFLERRLATRSLYVWEHDGPKRMASISGYTPNGLRVSAVFTPEGAAASRLRKQDGTRTRNAHSTADGAIVCSLPKAITRRRCASMQGSAIGRCTPRSSSS